MKIICIGLNYIEHLKEIRMDKPIHPVFFIKPDTSLLRNNQAFYYPSFSENIEYEVELVLRINKIGKSIAPEFAQRYYSEIGIGIDFTARDIQEQSRKLGFPWESSKAFDYSAPISPVFIPVSDFTDLSNINFKLDVNGKTVQKSNSKNMIFGFDEILAHVSQYVTLKIGDLIFTGTPAGVGSIKIGDNIQAYIEDKILLDFEIK